MNRLLRTALAGLSLFALVLGLSTPNIGEHCRFGHQSQALSLEGVPDDSRSILSESDLERRSAHDPADEGQRQASNLLQPEFDCEPVGGDDVFSAVLSLRDVDGAKLRPRIARGDHVRNLLHARSRSDFSRAPPQEQA